MNTHGSHRVRHRRTGPRRTAAVLLATLLTGIALLAVACGGSASSAAGSSPYAKALAYSQCMRSNGVANYPDPNSEGQIATNGNDIDYNSPQFAQATKACAKLAPENTITAQQRQQFLSQDLKYAACMRAHGITNFPDPSAASDNLGFGVPRADVNLPQFPAAEQACRSLSPGAASSPGAQS